jgi:hypothetical protein
VALIVGAIGFGHEMCYINVTEFNKRIKRSI